MQKIICVRRLLFFVQAFLFIATAHAQKNGNSFTNPLLPSGADPFSFYKDGFYYYTNSTGDNITLWKTRSLVGLKNAESKIIYTPPQGTSYSKELWAPEVHFINEKWYAYFAADDGNNNNHRMYVLENPSADPMKGEWIFKGKIADPSDKWAIDGDVFSYRNQLYMIWSGWEGDKNGQQDIYIAKLKNPWTIEGNRVRIASPSYAWEMNGDLNDPDNPPHVNVNEGPQALMHGDKLFVVFSASGCWTDHYALGLLSFTGSSNLLDSSAWKKNPEPVFKQSIENGVYAPGHNSFFKSPNGKEDWILYHANSSPGQGCGKNRSPRMQKFSWNKDGTPFFGQPVRVNQQLDLPSGTNKQN
jgi:GH43 family beta-xylosidase